LDGGSMTAIVGPNGSGKSSLLRVLAGAQRPGTGDVRTAGRVALIVSSINPPPDVTPRELVDYGLALRRPWWRLAPSAADTAATHAALASTGLTERADDAVATLSSGEIQRAWIAAALASSPAVLLVDEPTSHLDVRYQLDAMRMLSRLSRGGVAVAVAMHDLTLAARFADRIALLADGRLVSGPPEEILVAGAVRDAYGVEVTIHRHPTGGYLVCLPE
ncbi:MAG TPA: ABC transporter ATP-binding protein, partial [Candidatus Eremiobacteraceae bacterium]|nr:ABC transporter ATP-binding protein [Candidatus Eremiobacteraceae bacterium]